MENYLFRKGPRWVAIAANLIVLVVYAFFVWGWYARAVYPLMLIGPFGFLALAFATFLAFSSVGLEIRKLRDARRSGEKQWSKGTWLTLGLAAIPLLAGLAAVLWVYRP